MFSGGMKGELSLETGHSKGLNLDTQTEILEKDFRNIS